MKWKWQLKFSGEQVLIKEGSESSYEASGWRDKTLLFLMDDPTASLWTSVTTLPHFTYTNGAGRRHPNQGSVVLLAVAWTQEGELETIINHNCKEHTEHLHFPLNHGSKQFVLAKLLLICFASRILLSCNISCAEGHNLSSSKPPQKSTQTCLNQKTEWFLLNFAFFSSLY